MVQHATCYMQPEDVRSAQLESLDFSWIQNKQPLLTGASALQKPEIKLLPLWCRSAPVIVPLPSAALHQRTVTSDTMRRVRRSDVAWVKRPHLI